MRELIDYTIELHLDGELTTIELLRQEIDLPDIWRKFCRGFEPYLFMPQDSNLESQLLMAESHSDALSLFTQNHPDISSQNGWTCVRLLLQDIKSPTLKTTIAILRNFPDWDPDNQTDGLGYITASIFADGSVKYRLKEGNPSLHSKAGISTHNPENTDYFKIVAPQTNLYQWFFFLSEVFGTNSNKFK